jgi:legumain
MILGRLALLALFMVAVSADHYSVLIAGSSGFDNYRHQADVCHAYQLLLSKGIPADNIIVMSYDDVASSSENPYPNQLYNKPSSGKGVDVNKGCVIDYKGDDVTPDNYIAVITGGSTSGGNGRVLKSGSEDHVFLAFFDHGGTGLIGFPNSYLEADKLNSAFNTMHSNTMYK